MLFRSVDMMYAQCLTLCYQLLLSQDIRSCIFFYYFATRYTLLYAQKDIRSFCLFYQSRCPLLIMNRRYTLSSILYLVMYAHPSRYSLSMSLFILQRYTLTVLEIYTLDVEYHPSISWTFNQRYGTIITDSFSLCTRRRA